MKKRTPTEARLIAFVLEVVQQYAQLNKCRQAHYWTAGISIIEDAFWILHEYGVIKSPEKVRVTEIKRFYKNPLQNIT